MPDEQFFMYVVGVEATFWNYYGLCSPQICVCLWWEVMSEKSTKKHEKARGILGGEGAPL